MGSVERRDEVKGRERERGNVKVTMDGMVTAGGRRKRKEDLCGEGSDWLVGTRSDPRGSSVRKNAVELGVTWKRCFIFIRGLLVCFIYSIYFYSASFSPLWSLDIHDSVQRHASQRVALFCGTLPVFLSFAY